MLLGHGAGVETVHDRQQAGARLEHQTDIMRTLLIDATVWI